MSTVSVEAAAPRRAEVMSPGRLALWTFLASDALSFGALLLVWLMLHGRPGPWRLPTEPSPSVALGGLLAGVLLSGSALSTLGRRLGGRSGALLFVGAALLGVAFLGGQYHEDFGPGGLVAEGLRWGGSHNASTFYVLTGFHALHVAAGVPAMLGAAVHALRGDPRAGELAGLYWHFVDAVWVVLFGLLYLGGQL